MWMQDLNLIIYVHHFLFIDKEVDSPQKDYDKFVKFILTIDKRSLMFHPRFIMTTSKGTILKFT